MEQIAQEDVFQLGDSTIELSRVMSFENAADTARAPDGQQSLMVYTFDGTSVPVHGDADVQRFIDAMDKHLGLINA